jgi:hypothetical protein
LAFQTAISAVWSKKKAAPNCGKAAPNCGKAAPNCGNLNSKRPPNNK